VIPEDLARAIGIGNVMVIDPVADAERLEHALRDALRGNELTVIIVRRQCLLAAARKTRDERREENRAGRSAEATGRKKATSGEETGNEAFSAITFVPLLASPVNVVIAGLGGRAC